MTLPSPLVENTDAWTFSSSCSSVQGVTDRFHCCHKKWCHRCQRTEHPCHAPVFFGNLACKARDEAWETRSFQHVSVIAHCRSTEMENTDAEHFETTTKTALFPVCVFNWVRHSFRFAQAPTKTARWVDAEGSAGTREQQVLYKRINSEALCYF